MVEDTLNTLNVFLIQKRRFLFGLVIVADMLALFYVPLYFNHIDTRFFFNYATEDILKLYDAYVSFSIIIALNILYVISSKKETFSLLKHDALLNKYKKEIVLESGYIRSNSVLIFSEAVSFNQITCINTGEFYELPWFIQENGIKKLLQEFQLGNKQNLRNKLTLSLRDLSYNGKTLNLNFQTATYFDSLLTNSSADSKIIYNLTVRDLLEPGPALNPLAAAMPPNHLGVSCLVITGDGYMLLPKRGSNVNDFKNRLSPSVSGALNSDIASDNGEISLFTAISHEFIEELNFQSQFETVGSMQKYIRDNCKLIGITRELLRLGKPEAFFLLETNILERDFMSQLMDYNGMGETNNESKENDDYLFLHVDSFSERIKEITPGHYAFIVNELEYKISEPLLVNILLYLKLK